MMWELEPSKLWFCTSLEAFALQIPVLGDSVCVIMAVGTLTDHRRNESEEKFMTCSDICNQAKTGT